ncbi:MAG TPA: hypothetical protein VML75_03905, partial [Kofleriaceae bacterium]|nr:hypothetical protein [Kofleriaceae bacterium]
MLQRISTWAVAVLVAGAMACGGSQGETVTPLPSPDPTPAPADVRPAPQQAQPVEAKGNPANDLIPRAVLFGNPDKAGPQISPDGKQLSWLAPVDGVLNVWVAPV